MLEHTRVGNKVILSTEEYDDSRSNPRWGGKYGKVIGTIESSVPFDSEGYCLSVVWDNGYRNTYKPCDLDHYQKEKPINVIFEGKTGKAVCTLEDHYIVNFDEDMKGFSCDGRYKKGSCLVVKKSEVEVKKKGKER